MYTRVFLLMVRVMCGICLNDDLLLQRNIDGASILAKFVYYEYEIIVSDNCTSFGQVRESN